VERRNNERGHADILVGLTLIFHIKHWKAEKAPPRKMPSAHSVMHDMSVRIDTSCDQMTGISCFYPNDLQQVKKKYPLEHISAPRNNKVTFTLT